MCKITFHNQVTDKYPSFMIIQRCVLKATLPIYHCSLPFDLTCAINFYVITSAVGRHTDDNKFQRKSTGYNFQIKHSLTLILLTWKIWWAPNNSSKWQMVFNSAFKGLNSKNAFQVTKIDSIFLIWMLHLQQM